MGQLLMFYTPAQVAFLQMRRCADAQMRKGCVQVLPDGIKDPPWCAATTL